MPKNINEYLVSSPDQFDILIANKIIDICSDAINTKGIFSISIPAGRTPSGVWEVLKTEKYKEILDDYRVHIFFNDERIVSKDHPQNNFNQIFDSFLKSYSEINYHRIKSWFKPEDAESDYLKSLQNNLSSVNSLPQFDLVILGMGSDGHVASLFPGSSLLKANNRLIGSTKKKYNGFKRISLKFNLLNNSKNKILAVKGKEKYSTYFKAKKNGKITKFPVNGINLRSNCSNVILCKK